MRLEIHVENSALQIYYLPILVYCLQVCLSRDYCNSFKDFKAQTEVVY